MSNINLKTEAALADFIGGFYGDPYGFVMGVFPWGEATLPDGSENPLKDKTGPEPWQEEELKALGEHIRNNIELKAMDLEMIVWRSAIASGHGVGKSAFVAWIIYFLMSTRVDTRGVVTANTQFQLEDKTWPELAKWHNLAINNHWFLWTATGLVFKAYPEDKQKNYKMTAATVSEQKTEAFQGLHNEGKTVAVIFDEASGIPSKIWEVSEGALTDGEAFFFAFGNPTRPDGDFADCFDKHIGLYRTRHIDSRDVSHTNKMALQDIINKYGEDSDEVKVRIRGLFPSQSFDGFFDVNSVNDAIRRDLLEDRDAGLIMAVDVARYGNDHSVIGFRQGRDCRSRPFKRFKGLSLVQLADMCMKEADTHRPDLIVIEGGLGSGVIDIMRDRGYKVEEVWPGVTLKKEEDCVNNRSKWWTTMRDWVYGEGCLPEDSNLYSQLTTIKYSYRKDDGRTLIESKADIKLRGLPSPDEADTIAFTFAVTVARRDRAKKNDRRGNLAKTEYDVMNHEGAT